MSEIRLTQYSHGAGCGCKIAPAILDTILQQQQGPVFHPNLLVGNQERDDAAVFDLGDGTAVVSTTDFFMPIVDDPKDFGRIASVNAISDIYAMGGKPLVAIAILGWPINKLAPEVANQVVEGAREICQEAGMALAGGHSIDSPEPIFGLAVTGRVSIPNLKKNGGAKVGDKLFLSKALGVGILATAQKKAWLREEDSQLARNSMVRLNRIGEDWGQLPYVHAMTDVTGFGLLGHLSEMCEASNCSAKIDFAKVPLLDQEALNHYLDLGASPGGTHRNWASYGHKIGPISERQKLLLADPQTSGGLLVSVASDKVDDFLAASQATGANPWMIGEMTELDKDLIQVL